VVNTQFNAVTPLNQDPQRGPNFCPFCDFWHPVGSILADHIGKNHANLLPAPPRVPRTPEQRHNDAEARAEKIAGIRARKAAKEAGKAS
jgi:hypothetical protein